ncbi:MAG: ABC transporter ATP-binding protein [Candidatus Puniceispirillales bacterium]|jgi:branched-chain amino acid transport system ATP-binding protein|tara:strand:+ start:823 stop:1578 length:756 start_codon:yes stop_codon:yes gene_type:complete
MLGINSLYKSFGGIQAIKDVSLKIEKSSITALIGPNGAGKTTLFNIINGSIKPDSGSVTLNDTDITGYEPHQLFNLGILRTFQIAHEFSSLTVRDNLMMVPPNQTGESIMNTWFRQKKIKQEEQDILEKTNDVLDFLQLKHIANEYAGNLSGGQKKLLELGRTMMVKPKIVLLDEVGAGVNRTLLNTIGDAILRLNKDLNYTFCMIEHDIDFISRLCDPVIVMAEGSILMTDEISKVRKNEEVIEVYLGKN